MKKEEKSPEKELNKVEGTNLPNTEFKSMVIIMPNELRIRVEVINSSP